MVGNIFDEAGPTASGLDPLATATGAGRELLRLLVIDDYGNGA